MRAVVMREFGPPEVLEPAEVAEPEAGPGQVVIEAERTTLWTWSANRPCTPCPSACAGPPMAR